jgi:hypothetical protein
MLDDQQYNPGEDGPQDNSSATGTKAKNKPQGTRFPQGLIVDLSNPTETAQKDPGFNEARSRVRDTSIGAMHSQDEEDVLRQRNRIYKFIVENCGATCDEIEVGLGMLHQTASSRINQLARDGWLRDTGDRRETRTGRLAIVWGAVQ